MFEKQYIYEKRAVLDGPDGAVDEARTRDLHLGKVALYQLSYYRKTAYAVDGRWSG